MRIVTAGIGLRAGHVLSILGKTMPEAKVVGFYDPQPSHLEMIGLETPRYTSVETMLSDANPDLFFIGSPNEFHLEQIAIGLKAGVLIFTEKPVVVSLQQTMKLAELLTKHGAARVIVGLVLRHSQHMVDFRAAIDAGVLGPISSLEANEHIAPYHSAFFMRDWRRKHSHSGGFMLEKCCHDLDIYNMITGSRPKRVVSFGGRRSFLPAYAPASNSENDIFHIKKSVWNSIDDPFHSDADIVNCQTALVEFETGASMSFHTNTNVPDEHRRFCVIGAKGMAEGDFVRGYLKITCRDGSLFANHKYLKSEMTNDSAHYGADHLMVQDVVAFLRQECDRLPVSIVDALEAGVAALGIDQARASGQIIDLSPIWSEFDSYNLRQRKN
jgi:predicted dehydrogenase